MTREQRAEEWAEEWVRDGNESLGALLERFAIHEIAVWRRDNERAALEGQK